MKHSKVILFKAMQEDTHIKMETYKAFHEYTKTLATNNIDQVADVIQVINLDCHHRNILEKKGDTISDYLLKRQSMVVLGS